MFAVALFWTYWLPHYASIVWTGLLTIWLLLSPVALLLLLWPRYAAGSRHWLRILNRLLAAGGLLWMVSSAVEFLSAWFSQPEFYQYAFVNSYAGLYWWAPWRLGFLMILAQLFWVRRWRNSWVVPTLLPFGWLGSGFVIVWQLAHNDYLPASWPTSHWLPYFLP